MLMVTELSAASMDYEAAKSEDQAKQTASSMASANFFFSLLRISFQIIGSLQNSKGESEYLADALQMLSKQIAELTSLVIERFENVDFKLSLALRELNQLSDLVRTQSRFTTEQLKGIEARLETLAFANYDTQNKFYQKSKALIDEKTRLAVSYSYELSNPASRLSYLEESLIALRNLVTNFSTEIQRTSHVNFSESTADKLREIKTNTPGNLGYLLASEISQRNFVEDKSEIGMSLDTWEAGTELLITAIENSLQMIQKNQGLNKLSLLAIESSLEQGLKHQHSWNILKQENPKPLSIIVSNYESKLNNYLAELGANKELFSKLRSSELDVTQSYENILKSAENFSQPEWGEIVSYSASFVRPGPHSIKFKKLPDEVWRQVAPEFKLAIRLGLIEGLKAEAFPLYFKSDIEPALTKNDYKNKGIKDLDGNTVDLNQINDHNFHGYRIFWTLSAKYRSGPKTGQPVTFHISYGDPTVFFVKIKPYTVPGVNGAQYGLGTHVPFHVYDNPKVGIKNKMDDEEGTFQKNIFSEISYLPLDPKNRGLESFSSLLGFGGIQKWDTTLSTLSSKFFNSHFFETEAAPLNSDREKDLPELIHFFENYRAQEITTTKSIFMKTIAHAKSIDREQYKAHLTHELKVKLSLEKNDFLDRTALAFTDAETGQKSENVLAMEYQKELLKLALKYLYHDLKNEQVKSVFAILYGPQRLAGAKEIQADLIKGQSFEEIQNQSARTVKFALEVFSNIETQCGQVSNPSLMGQLAQLIELRDRLTK
jgi:hypothetical protein